MIIRLRVVDRDGIEHTIQTDTQRSLMQVLRELEYGVAAVCGGMCSCATCHVYVAPQWLERLPAPHGDERELVSQLYYRRESSRLSCQIQLSDALDGLALTLAPEE